MAETTNVSKLIINYLTEDQYQTAKASGLINENELYVTDVQDSTTLDCFEELFTATEGQTLFTLTERTYVPNQSRLTICVNGAQQPSTAYTETSSSSFTFDSGLSAGDSVIARYVNARIVSNIVVESHKTSHYSGGTDPLTPSDIGAATSTHTHTKSDTTDFAHKSTHAIGGSDALTAADIGAANASHTHPASMITDLPTGKKVARFVVGTSTAGWTAADCNYLCDGTDDQVEINAAIAALPATGGKVVILDGAYNITANITIPKDYVELCGTNNSRLTFANASYIDFGTKQHCTIHDLTLIGTQTANNKPILQIGGIWTHVYNLCTSKGSINLDHPCDIILTNCNIGYGNVANHGLDIVGGSLIMISNNQFGSSCIDIYATYADRLTIVNNIADAFSDTGIYLSDCSYSVITDNDFYSQVNNTIRGLCVIHSWYMLIANNQIIAAYANSTDCCVTINNTKQSTFTNNLILSYAPSVAPVQVIGGCNYINCANNTLITDTSYDIANSGNTNVTITGTVRWPLNI